MRDKARTEGRIAAYGSRESRAPVTGRQHFRRRIGQWRPREHEDRAVGRGGVVGVMGHQEGRQAGSPRVVEDEAADPVAERCDLFSTRV